MDLVSDILSHMRLNGTLYFRTSFTSPWGVSVPSFEGVSRFHFAHRGGCFVRVGSEPTLVPLEQGDLIIITRGAAHTLFCDPTTESDALTLDRVVEESGFTGKGTLVHGVPGTNHETQLVCGHFAFENDTSHPLIDALPSYIHIKDYGQDAGSWMQSTLQVIGQEAGRDRVGSDLIALKLSEIIFIQALRAYLHAEGANKPILAGFSDRQISKALDAFHNDPNSQWPLAALARVAGMSRTSFAIKFSRLLSMTPGNYITQWRMQLARRLLAESDAPIIEVAEKAGYQSEAAFSRVFKKHFALPPATYRRRRQRPTGDNA